MKHKVIFTTDRGVRHQQDALAAAPPGLEVTILRRPDKTTLMGSLAQAEFLISERFGVLDSDLFQHAPHLKLVQRLGSLTHDIDLEAASQLGIAVCYWPIRSVINVAEHLVMQILAVAKKLREVQAIALEASLSWGQSCRTDEDTFVYNWSARMDVNRLWQRTVGIIGFGEIGVEFARRLKNWGCNLIYYKRTRLPKQTEDELGLVYADQETLFSKSDYLVNLLPYFKETDLSLNAGTFSRMKTGAFLVSCGSGSVIDEVALTQAIQSGKLAGAALDTFEWEPIQADNPLIALAKQGFNVLLTPHTAAGTRQTDQPIPGRAQDYTNIQNYLVGQPLLYRVA
jgi:phosphoglycerate dehydrogenase-like enzyme